MAQSQTSGGDIVAAMVEAMDKAGITDNTLRNGLMAIVANESGLGEMKPELGYANTANSRIRLIFGSRVADLTEDQLTVLKSTDLAFFNYVYSGSNSIGRQLGNIPNTDDGYNFRGRGPIQITGRANYTKYGQMAGYDVVNNVDLLLGLECGAAITVCYIRDRYRGGGFNQLLAAVGSNTPDIAARKMASFNQYMSAGTYDYTGTPATTTVSTATPPTPTSRPTLSVGSTGPSVSTLQLILGVASDGQFGPVTENAVKVFQTAHGLTVDGVVGPLTWAALDSTAKESTTGV